MSQVWELHAANEIREALAEHIEEDRRIARQVRALSMRLRLYTALLGMAIGALSVSGYWLVKAAVRSVLIDDGVVQLTVIRR